MNVYVHKFVFLLSCLLQLPYFDGMLHTDNSKSILITTYNIQLHHCSESLPLLIIKYKYILCYQLHLLSFLSEQLSFKYNYI